jgi:hypothetical protein
MSACLVRERPLVSKQVSAFPVVAGSYSAYTFDSKGRRKWSKDVEVGRLPGRYVTVTKSSYGKGSRKVENVKFMHLWKRMFLAEGRIVRKGSTQYVVQVAHVRDDRIVFYRGLQTALTRYLRDVFGVRYSFVATDFSTGNSKLDRDIITRALRRHHRVLRKNEVWVRRWHQS